MGVEKRISSHNKPTVSSSPQSKIALARLLKILVLTVKYHYENISSNKEAPRNRLDKVIKECMKQKNELEKIIGHLPLTKGVVFHEIKRIAHEVAEKISTEDTTNRLKALKL